MKKLLYFISTFALHILFGYLAFKHIFVGIVMENSQFLSTPSASEQAESNFWFFLPLVIFVIVQAAAFVICRRIADSWGWKEGALSVLFSAAGMIFSIFLFVVMNP